RLSLINFSELQGDLIEFYRKRCSSIPLSPLLEEIETPLAGFYVMPDIVAVKHKSLTCHKEERTPMKTLKDLFSTGSAYQQEIYLSADTGFGKTAFSKYLAITWCQAHRPDEQYDVNECFKDNNLKALSKFEFLFLVFLRDHTSVSHIDDMIRQQFSLHLPSLKSLDENSCRAKLNEVLRREKCLIILDGLNEWTHPYYNCNEVTEQIPHRCERDNCVILTTTQPWKLGVSNLTKSQINQNVELAQLSEDSVLKLEENAIREMKGVHDDSVLKSKTQDFNGVIRKLGLEHMQVIPLLLMYILNLWCNNIPIGNSIHEVYTNIVEFLLSRMSKKHPEFQYSRESSASEIPEYLKRHEFCKRFYSLITSLAELAHQTLFNKNRENTFVFDRTVAEKYLKANDMTLSLLSGILSESRSKTLLKEIIKVSFSHKTVQEFFAAIFISSQSYDQKIVLEKCRSIQDILDMSKLFEFISGMNADRICAISNDLMSVINEDEKTRDYRTRTGDKKVQDTRLHDIQKMFMSCLQQMPNSENILLCIQDFFIDGNTVHSKQLQRLLKQNKTNIKSLYIDISDTSSSLREIIVLFSLTDLSHIQKLHYCGDVEKEAEINRILFPSLQVVTLEHVTWTNEEESSLFLSGDMLCIERVKLEDINMSTGGLQNFMTELQKLPQSVTVKMAAIKPRRQYDRVIEKIRKSPTFHVLADNYYHYYSDEDDNREWNFEFKTIKNDLRQYLERFYSESATFYNFYSDLEGSQNVSLEICPTFRKLDITNKEVTVMNQNESMTESLQMHKYPYNDIRRSKPILLLAEDTTSSANFIVSSWLNFGVNHTFFPMDVNTLEGVFWLKVRYFDDVSDLKTMLNNQFEMKKMYYSQQILIIFEYFDKDHFKLKAIYDLACSCNLKTCSFIIITNIDKQVVDDLKLNIEVVLIAAAINALYVYSKHLNVVIDGHELSRRIDQIVSEKKRDAITKICFVDIHPINSTAKICVPGDIKDIRFHRCSHKFQVIHFANHLEISEPPRFTNPLTENIFTPNVTTLTIHFESPSHIFYYNVYEHFACNISKANHIEFLRLCDMSFGKKVINVQLQKEEIEQIRRSVESKGDYCRFGARILGPRLGKITFDKEDIEIERSNSFVKQIMLDLICYELVKTHSSVSECYPSEMNDGAILLICFVSDEFQIDSFNGFHLLKRYNNNISKESLLAGNACDIEENTIVKALEDDFKDINETLSFHAEALMTSHRNLEAVKVSFVQHKDIQLVHSNLCIVLYCKAKGYIPFGDVCFPRTLNNPLKKKSFRTDVRDGFFSTCHFRSGHSTGFNKKLALGSSIGEVGGNLAATLGPFVNIKETNTTCFLTARHAFAPLSRSNESLKGVNVVQPADVHLIPGAVGLPNRHCGMVIESQDGKQIDASLVQISPERLPTSGQFIQLTKEDLDLAGLTKQPIYNDGKILDAKTLTVRDLARQSIIKIGYRTSLTKGTLLTTDGCVRETVEYSPLETLYNGSRESFPICSQIMVDSYYKKVFTQAGDSGSGVFLVDNKDSLHCIGMLIGVCRDMTAVVTPINNILQILGHKMDKTLELKKFRETEEMDES
ncbi:uncharacterized protein LOC132749813, partial [Ruditapes philippinarum]|uniref:uncharacterized protein LOC132749813 n=1 Tax=Ruditapes philippinarum TaxID=129788 RepID=UPI00295B36A5